jgi:hypothetical protein
VSDVTRILEAAQRGDSAAADQLLPLVCEDDRLGNNLKCVLRFGRSAAA